MDGQLVIFASYLGTAILLGGLGVPLVMEMIPPNNWYGFRTPSTLANEEIWYPVNRLTGCWLVIYGVASSTTAVCTYAANFPVDTAAWINLGVCMTCLAFMIIHPVRLLLKLKAAQK